MRLEKFLIEGRSEGIVDEEAYDTITRNCMKAYKAARERKAIIFRGVTGKRQVMRIDPKKGAPRRSANTSNYYTQFMDNEGTFKEYPKRSRSIICSTSIGKSMGYGNNTYVVLPVDGSKIGIVKNFDDIFNVGNKTVGSYMGAVNRQVRDIIYVYMEAAKDNGMMEYYIPGPWDSSWAQIRKTNTTIKKLNKNGDIRAEMEHWIHNEMSKKISQAWWEGGGSIFGFYKKVLDMNEFDLKMAGDSLSGYPTSEVWTDGYSILVELSTWSDDEFHRKLGEWGKK